METDNELKDIEKTFFSLCYDKLKANLQNKYICVEIIDSNDPRHKIEFGELTFEEGKIFFTSDADKFHRYEYTISTPDNDFKGFRYTIGPLLFHFRLAGDN